MSLWSRLNSPSVKMGALVLGVSSLLSRLVGIFRDRLLSSTFGAGSELDVYFAAFRIPDTIYNLIVLGAVSAGFIPVFTGLLFNTKKSEKERRRVAFALASRLLTFFVVLVSVLSVVGSVFASQLVQALTSGFTPEQQATTIMLTRIMLLSPVLLGISAVFGGVLQGMRHFLAFSLAPIFYNLGIIFGVLCLTPMFGVAGVAYGVVLGALVHACTQGVASMLAGYRPQLLFSFSDRRFRDVISAIGPRFASIAVSQANVVILTSMATTAGTGALAAFTFANNLQSLPVGVVGVSFAVSAFPLLAAKVAERKHDAVVAEFTRIVRMILFIMLPASVCFIMLRAQIVRVVYGSGRFDWADTIATADTLMYFSFGLFAYALYPLMVRMFFAYRDVVTPLVVGVIAVVLERVAAWKLVEMGMGAEGLALAVSIAGIVQCALLWVLLRRRLGSLRELGLMKSLVVMTLAALVSAFVMQAVKEFVGGMVDMDTFVGIATQGVVAGVCGLVAYVGLAYIGKNDEAHEVVMMLKRRSLPTAQSGIVQEGEKIEA